MTDTPSHSITITVTGRYAHGDATHCNVRVDGEGDLEHFVQAFQTVLVAAGFAAQTAGSLVVERP